MTLLDATRPRSACCAGTGQRKAGTGIGTRRQTCFGAGRCTRHTHDIHANVESVKKAVELSRELLGDGEVQKARPIVANLASEIVIQTDNLPMATYRAAISSAARLIDSGKSTTPKRNSPSTEHAGGDLGRLSSARATSRSRDGKS
ncbi:YfdX family protein [Enterobacter hormaechei]